MPCTTAMCNTSSSSLRDRSRVRRRAGRKAGHRIGPRFGRGLLCDRADRSIRTPDAHTSAPALTFRSREQAAAALRALSTHADVSLVQRDSNLGSGVPAYSYYYNYLALRDAGAGADGGEHHSDALWPKRPVPAQPVRTALCAQAGRPVDVGQSRLSIACWALLVLCSFVLYGGSLLTSALLPLLLPQQPGRTRSCASASYLLGQLVKSAPRAIRHAQHRDAGMSFCAAYLCRRR